MLSYLDILSRLDVKFPCLQRQALLQLGEQIENSTLLRAPELFGFHASRRQPIFSCPAMACSSSMHRSRVADLGNCLDAPAKDGQIELERSKLGKEASRITEIQTSFGHRARTLRRLDPDTLSAEPQMGPQ
jgi:hypothetical protein